MEMVRTGLIGEDEPVELLDGVLVKQMGKRSPHWVVKKLLLDAFSKMIPGGWYVDDQEPITLATSEPEPDVMIIRGAVRDCQAAHPSPPNVALVVEIADSTLTRDREWKRRIYREAAIPVYWIVNLIDRTIELYSAPASGDYQTLAIYKAGDNIPVLLDGKTVGEIDVGSVLP
jgi:Uma2 family endonuclease